MTSSAILDNKNLVKLLDNDSNDNFANEKKDPEQKFSDVLHKVNEKDKKNAESRYVAESKNYRNSSKKPNKENNAKKNEEKDLSKEEKTSFEGILKKKDISSIVLKKNMPLENTKNNEINIAEVELSNKNESNIDVHNILFSNTDNDENKIFSNLSKNLSNDVNVIKTLNPDIKNLEKENENNIFKVKTNLNIVILKKNKFEKDNFFKDDNSKTILDSLKVSTDNKETVIFKKTENIINNKEEVTIKKKIKRMINFDVSNLNKGSYNKNTLKQIAAPMSVQKNLEANLEKNILESSSSNLIRNMAWKNEKNKNITKSNTLHAGSVNMNFTSSENINPTQASTNLFNASSISNAQVLDMNHKEWTQKLAKIIEISISNGKKMVEIKLEPQKLGRMVLSLNMNGDSAEMSIRAESHNTVQAITDSQNTLQKMLSNNGINLNSFAFGQENQNFGEKKDRHSEELTTDVKIDEASEDNNIESKNNEEQLINIKA